MIPRSKSPAATSPAKKAPLKAKPSSPTSASTTRESVDDAVVPVSAFKQNKLIESLLVANIRSGTLAFMFCFKTQHIRRISRWFHRWKSNIASMAPLNSIQALLTLNRSYPNASLADIENPETNSPLALEKDLEYENYRLRLLSFAQSIVTGSSIQKGVSSGSHNNHNNNNNNNNSDNYSSNNHHHHHHHSNSNSINKSNKSSKINEDKDMFKHVVVDVDRDPDPSSRRQFQEVRGRSRGIDQADKRSTSAPPANARNVLNRSFSFSPAPRFKADSHNVSGSSLSDAKDGSDRRVNNDSNRRSSSTDSMSRRSHVYNDRQRPIIPDAPLAPHTNMRRAVISDDRSGTGTRTSTGANSATSSKLPSYLMPTRASIGGLHALDLFYGNNTNNFNSSSRNTNVYRNNGSKPINMNSSDIQGSRDIVRPMSASPTRRRGVKSYTSSGKGAIDDLNERSERGLAQRPSSAGSNLNRLNVSATTTAPKNKNNNNSYSSGNLNDSKSKLASVKMLVAEHASTIPDFKRLNNNNNNNSNNNNNNNSNNINNNKNNNINNNNNNSRDLDQDMVRPAVDVVRVGAFQSFPLTLRQGENETMSVSTISESIGSSHVAHQQSSSINNNSSNNIIGNSNNNMSRKPRRKALSNDDSSDILFGVASELLSGAEINSIYEPVSLLALADKGMSLAQFTLADTGTTTSSKANPSFSEIDDAFSEGVSEMTNDLSILHSAKKAPRPIPPYKGEMRGVIASDIRVGGGGGVGSRRGDIASSYSGRPIGLGRGPRSNASAATSRAVGASNHISINHNNFNNLSHIPSQPYPPRSNTMPDFSANRGRASGVSTNSSKKIGDKVPINNDNSSKGDAASIARTAKSLSMDPAQFRLIFGADKTRREKRWGDTLRK